MKKLIFSKISLIIALTLIITSCSGGDKKASATETPAKAEVATTSEKPKEEKAKEEEPKDKKVEEKKDEEKEVTVKKTVQPKTDKDFDKAIAKFKIEKCEKDLPYVTPISDDILSELPDDYVCEGTDIKVSREKIKFPVLNFDFIVYRAKTALEYTTELYYDHIDRPFNEFAENEIGFITSEYKKYLNGNILSVVTKITEGSELHEFDNYVVFNVDLKANNFAKNAEIIKNSNFKSADELYAAIDAKIEGDYKEFYKDDAEETRYNHNLTLYNLRKSSLPIYLDENCDINLPYVKVIPAGDGQISMLAKIEKPKKETSVINPLFKKLEISEDNDFAIAFLGFKGDIDIEDTISKLNKKLGTKDIQTLHFENHDEIDIHGGDEYYLIIPKYKNSTVAIEPIVDARPVVLVSNGNTVVCGNISKSNPNEKDQTILISVDYYDVCSQFKAYIKDIKKPTKISVDFKEGATMKDNKDFTPKFEDVTSKIKIK